MYSIIFIRMLWEGFNYTFLFF